MISRDFIHQIAQSIQASSVIESLDRETIATIVRLLAVRLGLGPDEERGQVLKSLEKRAWHKVREEVGDYIQSLDNDALLLLARECDRYSKSRRCLRSHS